MKAGSISSNFSAQRPKLALLLKSFIIQLISHNKPSMGFQCSQQSSPVHVDIGAKLDCELTFGIIIPCGEVLQNVEVSQYLIDSSWSFISRYRFDSSFIVDRTHSMNVNGNGDLWKNDPSRRQQRRWSEGRFIAVCTCHDFSQQVTVKSEFMPNLKSLEPNLVC